MAITIDWGNTYVINVPKADMTLVQSTPTEIRELDLNVFRLELKDLEDGENGIPFLDTHIHNTEVTLGGLTFARVIEILDPYSVTFEDGQYAVNLVGANSNVGDKVNVNQVSVRSNNSAGLISTPLIEFSSFEGGVWINESSSYAGTTFPIGTKIQPVNNLADAKLIAEYRGFNTIKVMQSVIVDSGLNYSDYVFEGDTHVHDSVDVSSAADVTNTVFRNLNITGTLDGDNEIVESTVEDLQYVNGFIRDSGLIGDLTLAGGSIAHFNNCYMVDTNDHPIVDMGGSGQDLIMPDYSGKVTIANLTGSNYVGIGLDAGRVILSGSVVSGIISVSGTGRLVDGNGAEIMSGTWNGGVTIVNDLANASNMADAVWDESIADHLSAGSTGAKLNTASAGGVDYDVLADAVWDEDIVSAHTTVDTAGHVLADSRLIRRVIHVDTDATSNGDGTAGSPFDNIGDAIDAAEAHSIKEIAVYAEVTVDRNLKNFTITGIGSPIINCNGQDLKNSEFTHCTLRGTYIDRITATECLLDDGFQLDGIFDTVALNGDLTCANNATVLLSNAVSNIAGLNRPTISMNSGTATQLSIRNYSGGLTILDSDHVNDACTVEMNQGKLTIDSTCTAGIISVRGISQFVDNSAGATVDTTGLFQPEAVSQVSIANAVWDADSADYLDVGTLGKLIADVLEDTSTTIPTLLSTMQTNVEELLGLTGENVVWSSITHNADNLMTAARITHYTDNTLVTPIKSWDVTATYNANGEITSHQMVDV